MWGAVKAGYTLAELLLLSRSASLPQRAAAFHVLGAVLKRARIPAPQATQQRGRQLYLKHRSGSVVRSFIMFGLISFLTAFAWDCHPHLFGCA